MLKLVSDESSRTSFTLLLSIHGFSAATTTKQENGEIVNSLDSTVVECFILLKDVATEQ